MSDSSGEFQNVDVSGSPLGYKKETIIDSNSNIDRIFIPKFPSAANKGSRPSSEDSRSGIRTSVNWQLSAGGSAVAPAPSPILNRSLKENQRKGADGGVPLVLFNPSYSNRLQAVEGNSAFGSSPLVGLDSSPEFPMKSSREKLSTERSLKLRVEVEERRGPSGVQPSHSSLDSSGSDSPRYWEPPERRDSGVGSSLSRSPRLVEFRLCC